MLLLAALHSSASLWPKLIYAVTIMAQCTIYVIQQIRKGRRSGASWEQTLRDGGKPITGSVWADAAIFAGVFFGGLGAIVYVVLRMIP